jgi:hypothetical protein
VVLIGAGAFVSPKWRLKANGLAVETKMTRPSRRALSPQVAGWRRPGFCKSSGISCSMNLHPVVSRCRWLLEFLIAVERSKRRQSRYLFSFLAPLATVAQDALVRRLQSAAPTLPSLPSSPLARPPPPHLVYDPMIHMLTWITIGLAVSSRYPNATVQ